MRHGKKFNHLSRKAPHRKAMLANMACSLIEHKRIKTTVAKAKALRVYIEPLLTKSKEDTTHSRRTIFSYLKQKQAITELFGDVAAKIADRPGGYTRILKLSNRLGDNAEMCFIELVDYNEDYQTDKPKRKKTRRRGASKTTETQTAETAAVEQKTEVILEENIEEVEVTDDVKVDETTTETAEVAEDEKGLSQEEEVVEQSKEETAEEEQVEAVEETTATQEDVQEVQEEKKEVEAVEDKVEETEIKEEEDTTEENVEEVSDEKIQEVKDNEKAEEVQQAPQAELTEEKEVKEEKHEETVENEVEEEETKAEDVQETEDNSDEQKKDE
jgi:large subunit ribosomal protein L17